MGVCSHLPPVHQKANKTPSSPPPAMDTQPTLAHKNNNNNNNVSPTESAIDQEKGEVGVHQTSTGTNADPEYGAQEALSYTPAEANAVRRKLDLRVLPLFFAVYVFAYVDRSM